MWFCAHGLFSYLFLKIMLQGEEGVREVLQILNDEFRLSMALSGKTWDAKLMFFLRWKIDKQILRTHLPQQ